MLRKTYFISVSIFISVILYSCSSGDDAGQNNGSNTTQIIPTNLEVSITIEGEDSENPNGDGSGVFYGIASAVGVQQHLSRTGHAHFSGPHQWAHAPTPY